MLADRCCSRRTCETWEKLSFWSVWRRLMSPSDPTWLHPAVSVCRALEATTAKRTLPLFSPKNGPNPPPRTIQLLADWRHLAAVCLLSHGSLWPPRLVLFPPIRRTYAPTVLSNPISWFAAWSPPGGAAHSGSSVMRWIPSFSLSSSPPSFLSASRFFPLLQVDVWPAAVKKTSRSADWSISWSLEPWTEAQCGNCLNVSQHFSKGSLGSEQNLAAGWSFCFFFKMFNLCELWEKISDYFFMFQSIFTHLSPTVPLLQIISPSCYLLCPNPPDHLRRCCLLSNTPKTAFPPPQPHSFSTFVKNK